MAQLSRSPKKSIEAIEHIDHCQFVSSQTNRKTSITTTVQSSNHSIPTCKYSPIGWWFILDTPRDGGQNLWDETYLIKNI